MVKLMHLKIHIIILLILLFAKLGVSARSRKLGITMLEHQVADIICSLMIMLTIISKM